MALAPEQLTLGLRRHFTTGAVSPFDMVTWERRDARLIDWRTGAVSFEQLDVEVPSTWSVNATNILAQKYLRGPLGTPERESSLRQVVERIVGTITAWGLRDGYFADRSEASVFADELSYLLVTQRAAFNSPVWFNIGVDNVPQQASACFILAVDDTMDAILNWYVEEGRIFKGGSGAGVNLSRIRASTESLGGGGTASGPVSFMRGADASAGTIKSGGKTRRAAKMVVLDVDHPDIEEFVWCKAREEHKARALRDAGFDMDLDGADSFSIQYQNANNSVRVSDAFMEAALEGRSWPLLGRMDGSVQREVPAGDLLRAMAEAAWECADPGVQYDTTINRWHTAPAAGRISASNPCSEYMHLDNSACNLASLNLLTFLVPAPDASDDAFDVEAFRHAVEIVFTAQEILVGNADYPTDAIGETTRAFRQLGLGYANLGALLMALGLPYDAEGGRAIAASITALMTGHAYLTSSRLAARMGPFAGYHANAEAMQRVLGMHRDAAAHIDEDNVPTSLLSAAQMTWDEACESAATYGVRNAQATVLAPTGTIGLLMDCDTTGVEPDLGLVKTKKLVGGGSMSIVNQTIPRALTHLGYDSTERDEICAYIAEHNSVLAAPHLAPEHRAVFACSMGDNPIHHLGHVTMMAAVQPFLSGAISKTVNLPESASVADIEDVLVTSWRLGLKAVAIYRDNCKVGQPLSVTTTSVQGAVPAAAPMHVLASDVIELVPTGAGLARPAVAGQAGAAADAAARAVANLVESSAREPVRQKLPRRRVSRTFEFRVADCKGFVTIGEYTDGRPGELFIRVSKQGSTLAGIMDAFAISVSHGLQYGVPLRAFVEAFVGMRFEPAGMTDDPDIRLATSLMDYLFRRLAVEYLTVAERAELNIFTTGERTQPTLPGVEETVTETVQGIDITPDPPSIPSASQLRAQLDLGWHASNPDPTPAPSSAGPAARTGDSPFCMSCGIPMQRAGSCFVCTDCGTTSGCS